MEFRDKICNILAYSIPQLLLVWEDIHSIAKIFVPLTGNVVRNVKDQNFAATKLLPEDKVDVKVPV